jgi:hypothetical protein
MVKKLLTICAIAVASLSHAQPPIDLEAIHRKSVEQACLVADNTVKRMHYLMDKGDYAGALEAMETAATLCPERYSHLLDGQPYSLK